eukprot:SAG11_NODE_4974_length_1706_cov_1.863721_1_plen_474_part_00
MQSQLASHSARLTRLNAVAGNEILTAMNNTSKRWGSKQHEIEMIAVGHRLYFDQRWDDASAYYENAKSQDKKVKTGQPQLFSIFILLAARKSAGLEANAEALRKAIALAQDDCEADAVTSSNWLEGNPCVKKDYAMVYTMALLLVQTLDAKILTKHHELFMWPPVAPVLRGKAPGAYRDENGDWSGAWFDKLRKVKLDKNVFVAAAQKLFDEDPVKVLHITVRLAYCARLPNKPLPGQSHVRALLTAPRLNFGISVRFKDAVGSVLRCHPHGSVVEGKKAIGKELMDIMRVHFANALRGAEIARADKLISAGQQLFGATDIEFCRRQRFQGLMFYLRIAKQSLLKTNFPVPADFVLPARLQRHVSEIVMLKKYPNSHSQSKEFEACARANAELLHLQCWSLIQPALAFLKRFFGRQGWNEEGHGVDEGDVTHLSAAKDWAVFVLPYRILLRHMWYQELRDRYSLARRAVLVRP